MAQVRAASGVEDGREQIMSDWITIWEASDLSGRAYSYLYKRAAAGQIRTRIAESGGPNYRVGTKLFYRPDVEALGGPNVPRRTAPEICKECAWFDGRECGVFTELWPREWRTEDGGCQAYARFHHREAILQREQAYAVRFRRRTAELGFLKQSA